MWLKAGTRRNRLRPLDDAVERVTASITLPIRISDPYPNVVLAIVIEISRVTHLATQIAGYLKIGYGRFSHAPLDSSFTCHTV